MCLSTFDVPGTECWTSRCSPWRPAGVRVSAHVNMHAAWSSVKVKHNLACWHNTRTLRGEMITFFPGAFCLSGDLEVQKEPGCPQRCRGGLQGDTSDSGGMRAATTHGAAKALAAFEGCGEDLGLDSES